MEKYVIFIYYINYTYTGYIMWTLKPNYVQNSSTIHIKNIAENERFFSIATVFFDMPVALKAIATNIFNRMISLVRSTAPVYSRK